MESGTTMTPVERGYYRTMKLAGLFEDDRSVLPGALLLSLAGIPTGARHGALYGMERGAKRMLDELRRSGVSGAEFLAAAPIVTGAGHLAGGASGFLAGGALGGLAGGAVGGGLHHAYNEATKPWYQRLFS